LTNLTNLVYTERMVANVLSPEELVTEAKKEVGEDETRLQEDLQALRSWLKKSPHLKEARQDDAKLLQFLRGCKFSLERTKEKLDLYNSCRASLPDWFEPWDPSAPIFQKIINFRHFLPLPGYDCHGRQVILLRPGKLDPSKTSLEEVAMCTLAFLELVNEGNAQAQVKGTVMLNDLQGAGPQHALMMNPVSAKKMVMLLQEAYPARPKGMHFLNFPPAMQAVYNLMQSFQKEKMRQRNKIHPKGDYASLWAEVGKEVLPTEYGGEGGPVADIEEKWQTKVMENKSWLMEQARHKSNETLRPGKPRSHADIFGIEGSFRRLDID